MNFSFFALVTSLGERTPDEPPTSKPRIAGEQKSSRQFTSKHPLFATIILVFATSMVRKVTNSVGGVIRHRPERILNGDQY